MGAIDAVVIEVVVPGLFEQVLGIVARQSFRRRNDGELYGSTVVVASVGDAALSFWCFGHRESPFGGFDSPGPRKQEAAQPGRMYVQYDLGSGLSASGTHPAELRAPTRAVYLPTGNCAS